MIQAQFKLSLVVERNLVEWNETDLANRFDDIRASLADVDDLEGAITISGPNLPPFEIGDEMVPLVLGFCLGAITGLKDDPSTHVYHFFNCGSTCVFVVHNGRVIILSDDDQEDMPTLRCPLDPLLVALYECSVRYIHFVQRLEDAGLGHAIPDGVRVALEDARVALVGKGLISG